MKSIPALKVALALSLLTGCWGVPVGSDAEPVDIGSLKSTIGSSKTIVRERLGQPAYEIEGDQNSYFLYEDSERINTVLLFLYIPLWAGKSRNTDLQCVLLEFDQNEKLVKYETKAETWSRLYKLESAASDCRSLFSQFDKSNDANP